MKNLLDGIEDVLLMGPGPSCVPPEVYEAIGKKTLGHLDPYFLKIMDELKEHAELMRKMPGMEHDEPNMATLKPGQRGDIVWQFDKPGTVDFACLSPGHMEAGMVGKVKVK